MLDPSVAAAIAWKTSVLLVAIGLIASLTTRQSAARRHFLWTCALALSLLMPVAVVSLPSYVQVTLPWEAAELWARDTPALVTAAPRNADVASEVRGSRPTELAAAARLTDTASSAAMIVWLIGAAVVMLRNALAHLGLMRWVRQARPDLSPAWEVTLRRVASDAALRRPLRVLESDHTTSPCTFGLMRPVILLPAAGAGWPEAQRQFTLLHELAHVRRLDYLTTQIASLACAVHWFNPLVWFAAIQARKLQEQACDDEVLNAGGTPSDYAQFLVSIAGGARHLSPAFPAAIGMLQRSLLHGRVTAILDASTTRLPLSRVAFVVALAPLACLTFFLATLSAAAMPVAMQPGVPVAASFSSVELRNGATATLIHGGSQRVTLLEGDLEQASISVRDDGRLVIDRCPAHCPRRHNFAVEVTTPALTAIAVAQGGTIQSRGEFPRQTQIDVAVSQGGTIDLRSMALANITASVESGGRIFVKPTSALSATVEQGGVVTYWGDAVVKSSVQHGGAVIKGTASDADKSLAELGPKPPAPPPPVPPVPPVPAVQPISR
jgi:Antirepressor regulating drug resistance, predicted signal transduction N-terminal membrane component